MGNRAVITDEIILSVENYFLIFNNVFPSPVECNIDKSNHYEYFN